VRRRQWSGRVALAVLLIGIGGGPASAGTPVDPLAGPGLLVSPAAAATPVVTATSFIVADLADGDVLAAQNARLGLAPASAQKLLTALALGPDLPDDLVWTASFDAAAVDGSKVGTVPGSTYTVADLMHGLVLGSGNDCAQAIAELSGGMAAAASEMSAVARDLGATDTVVTNTSGLDAPGQVTSARDLALVGRAALDDERLASLVTTERYAFPGAGTTFGPERPRFEVGNHNRLIGGYPGALGLKTGYTDAARSSIVAAAERDGRRYVVVVLQAEGQTWRHAAALLDWAFATPADLSPVGSLDAVPGQSEVEGDGAAVEPDTDVADDEVPVGNDGQGPGDDVVAAPATDRPAGPWWADLPTPALVLAVLLSALLVAAGVMRARVLLLRRR